MISYLRRVTISQKLIFCSAVFIVPIAILLTGFIQGHLRDVRFSTLEKYGNRYQRPLEELLSALPAHMFAALEAQTGDTAAQAQADSVADQIDDTFKQLDRVQNAIGSDLQFDAEGLGKRNRIQVMPDRVASRWQDAKSAHDKESIIKLHSKLLDDIAIMISHCGDTSNLILDPDLDSYYIMDMTLLALPQMQIRLVRILDEIHSIYEKGELDQDDRLTLLTYAALLDESDIQRVLGSAATALNEDENFYGSLPSLQKNLPPALAEFKTVTSTFLENIKRLASQSKLPDDVPAILDSGEKAAKVSFSLWNTAVDELDTLLEIRIQDYMYSNWFIIILTLVTTFLAGVLVFCTIRSIVIPLHRIGDFSKEVAHGNLKATISGDFSGELSALSDDIQAMVVELKIRLGFSQGILDGITAPFIVASPENVLNYTNHEMLDMLELPGKPEDYNGKSVAEVLWDDPSHETVTLSCLSKNQNVSKKEVTYHGRQGGLRTAIVDANVLYDFDGNRIGCCALYNDITNLKQHELEIEEQNKTMSDVAREAQGIADQVTRASEELGEQIEHAAQGASVQSERTTETASAMEQMNASVIGVAGNAADAVKSADQAHAMADEGRQQVHVAMKSIAAVETDVLELQLKMQSLGEQTQTVGRIVAVITDIADQTNLLALNAAIEAARAGEAGRGFAVVADEVRKLAEKTMQATQEVTSSISSIQNGTSGAISATETVVERMVESSKQAEQSGIILKQIVDIVQGTAQQIEAIAAAAEEQARTSESINMAVEEVNRISVETADGMRLANEAVADLSSHAERLQNLIEKIQ